MPSYKTRQDWRIKPEPARQKEAFWEVVAFFLITFAITWGVAALSIFSPDFVLGDDGFRGARGRSFFFLAVYGPTLAGLMLTLTREGFVTGLKGIWRGAVAPGRVTPWLLWLFIGLAIVPAAWGLTVALSKIGLANETIGLFVPSALLSVPLVLATTPYIFTDPGPIGEEYGWRGYLLPRLLELTDPIRASIIIGIAWGVWHLPAFFNAAMGQADNVFVFMLANWIGWSLLATWIFIRMNGNWLIPGVISHAAVNASLNVGGAAVDPIYSLGAMLAAIVLILWRGPSLDLNRNMSSSDAPRQHGGT
ncbi:MAG: CPBP family intramembrane glutamic endopeptidase [Pseudomonadota bacterium]